MTRETNEAINEIRQLLDDAIEINDAAVLRGYDTDEDVARIDGLLDSVGRWADVARGEIRTCN
jgi:hypothetical protein